MVIEPVHWNQVPIWGYAICLFYSRLPRYDTEDAFCVAEAAACGPNAGVEIWSGEEASLLHFNAFRFDWHFDARLVDPVWQLGSEAS